MRAMKTVVLYHGPGAKDAALAAAAVYGPLYYPPFGEEGGLGIDVIREVVGLMYTPIAGGRDVALVVGPLDKMRDAAGDALLKTLEEPPVEKNHLILYAEDAYVVSATIRSRVKTVFCPGEKEEDSVDLSEFLSGQGFWKIIGEYKGREQTLLRAVVKGLDPGDPRSLEVYDALRPLTLEAILTPSMILSALWEKSVFLRGHTNP